MPLPLPFIPESQHRVVALTSECLTNQKNTTVVQFNAIAHATSDTGKYDRGLMWLLHNEFHWLAARDRVPSEAGSYGIQLSERLHTRLSGQLFCVLLSTQRHLCSTSRIQLNIPRHRLRAFGRPQPFAIASLTAWNSQSSRPCPEYKCH